MKKSLLIFGFIASVAVNSLAAVTPHFEGEGGCSSACCRAAHGRGQEALRSSLCCLVDCKQSGTTQSLSPTSQIATTLRDCSTAIVVRPEALLSSYHVRFPNSPTRNVAGSSDRYLQTGSLLI